MTRVKICGNTNAEDIAAAIDFGADYLGLIFTESPRRIDPALAKRWIPEFPYFGGFVGVFSGQSVPEIGSIAREVGLRTVQLHGDEPPEDCQSLAAQGFHVIKTLRIRDRASLKDAQRYGVEAFLLDTFVEGKIGGTGLTFDWSIFSDEGFDRTRMGIAGGLTPENVAQAVRKARPWLVDTVSGVETSPGKKDFGKMRAFIEAVRKENAGYAVE
ncbi:MAG: phosphoribosylanthranilate isomerase [Candidatus Omnitrophota bacterium]